MGVILVADDDAHSRGEVVSVLDGAGWETIEACSGQEAVDAARLREFDLVLLDVSMPGLNGLEALRVLHRAHPQLKVCMLSALDHLDLLAEATRDAAVDILTKPVCATELLRTVEKWCSTSAA